MAKKKGLDVQSGRDVVEYASKHGAEISQRKDGRVKISTEKGSMLVYDNNHPYSSVDKGNVKRWLRILGLLIVLLVCTGTFLWIQHVISVRAGM